MKNQNNLKSSSLRKRLRILYHQDGILDLVMGSCLALLTLVMAFDQPAFIGLIGIPAIFYFPLKNQITVPRMGLIRFESEEKTRSRLGIITLLGIALFAIFVLSFILLADSAESLQNLIWQNEILIFALLMASLLFTLGALMKNKRFLIYAVISLLLTAVTQLLATRLWLAVAGTALILISTGIYKLVQFHRHYPTPASE